MPKGTYDPKTVTKAAKTIYVAELKKDKTLYPFSPAAATKTLATRYGVPAARLVPIVAAVYYEENGRRSPLSLPASRTPSSLAKAVRKARDAGGRLGRWEVLAWRLGEALGRPVSVAAVRGLYEKGGGSSDASYTGRGTRAGAVATRSDATVEVEAAAS